MLTISSIQDPQLAELLRKGSVGVIPTDTIYGLCTLASNHNAVARMYALKNREQKPGTLIAASVDQLIALGIDEPTLRSVADNWPNPISIIIPSPPSLAYLDLELGGLAVRIPKDEALRKLIETVGVIVTTSANDPGKPPANNLAEATGYFGDAVDFYVDGGDLSGRIASTVARATDTGLVVLRQGAVAVREDQPG
ncbi:MAG TPA: L-threonylcarbamoyladenylate synthase [Candidatus Saccharimonadales bacterium]|nr:L-threonylcarbamoyladenylate synthase [Candidatus Saccharimonadales bacterium]